MSQFKNCPPLPKKCYFFPATSSTHLVGHSTPQLNGVSGVHNMFQLVISNHIVKVSVEAIC